MSNLATCLEHQGEYAVAEPFRRAALGKVLESNGGKLAFNALYFASLAGNLIAQGKQEEQARANFARCEAILADLTDNDSMWIGRCRLAWASGLHTGSLSEEARQVAGQANAILSRTLPPDNFYSRKAINLAGSSAE